VVQCILLELISEFGNLFFKASWHSHFENTLLPLRRFNFHIFFSRIISNMSLSLIISTISLPVHSRISEALKSIAKSTAQSTLSITHWAFALKNHNMFSLFINAEFHL